MESDTSPKIQEMMYDRYRRLTPEQRLSKMNDLWVAGRKLMVAGIMDRMPDATDSEVKEELKKIVSEGWNKNQS